MEILSTLVSFLVAPVQALWRRSRFGPRVELELTWKWPIMFFVTDATEVWRGIKITVTGPKHEEFVVAGGRVEVRAVERGKWTAVADLEDLLGLPLTVPANRQEHRSISGRPIVDGVPAEIRDRPLLLRVTLQDHHRLSAQSEPLKVDCRELLKTEWH